MRTSCSSASRLGSAPMAQKRYLFTPGPTPVPPQVLAALAEPVLHHRAPDFRIVYERVLGRLQEVHRTSADVLLFTCSGTGAFESAIVNLCSPGERVLAVSAGQFGERWAAMARGYGCEVEELRYDWGETPTAGRPRRAGSPSSSRSPSSSSSTPRRRPASSATCRRSRPPRRRRARSSSSTRSRASAPFRSRRTTGGSTSSSPARRRR